MFDDMPVLIMTGECLSCDGCCRFPAQDCWTAKTGKEERSALEGAPRALPFPSGKSVIDEKGAVATVEVNGHYQCVFFKTENGHCLAYTCRPFECRLYPFVVAKDNGKIVVAAHTGCPYVMQHQGEVSFIAHIDALRQYFKKPTVRQFVMNNECVAGDYSSCSDIDVVFTVE